VGGRKIDGVVRRQQATGHNDLISEELACLYGGSQFAEPTPVSDLANPRRNWKW